MSSKVLGKTTVKMEWAVGWNLAGTRTKLKSLDLINKKTLIKSKHKKLTITEQCELLSISRSSYYYKPKPIKKEDIKILHSMDEIYTDSPEYGYRFIYQ